MARFSFTKPEKLTGKKNIDRLFKSGKQFKIEPFKVIWFIEEIPENQNCCPAKILISVPKKNHKRSVVRNLIKRRIRESYRLNKPALLDFLKENNISLHWGVIYLSEEIYPFSTIEKKMILILQKIESKILEQKTGTSA